MKLQGYTVIEDANMVDGPFEDWSRVRSPGRARRRRLKHRQNIRLFYTPKTQAMVLPAEGIIVLHPDMAEKLRAQIGEDATESPLRCPAGGD